MLKSYGWVPALLLLMQCQGQSSNSRNSSIPTDGNVNPTYVWKKLLDSAAWEKSYNFQMFSFKDTMWTFHSDGNWFSTDGTHWTKSNLPNAIYNLAFLDYISFGDGIFGLGHFEGNIERYSFRPVIYKSSDMRNWDTLSTNSNLPKRFFYHPFVFKDKIWIAGGEDASGPLADIWNSEDGVQWNRVKEKAAFGKRANSKIVELNGYLYLLNNDVWRSKDALGWEMVTSEIVKGESVFGYEAVVLDDKIWLLGCNRNGQFTSQVLVSGDGKNWEGQDAPWTPRGGIAGTVHHGKVYMTGGKYGGTPDQPVFRYSNDVWVMEKSKTP